MKTFTTFAAFPALVLIVLTALSACGGDPEGTVVVVDGVPTVFPGTSELDPAGDADSDGITNGAELEGYTITVNSTGWTGQTQELRVISNPLEADTDGDGLDDNAELVARTHPLRSDTDGDGLNDHEEITFWGTSPTQVDSDGDAVGTDGVARPPNPALFDGAELKLRREGATPEMPGIPGVGATSPKMTDTDGDTVDDYVETMTPGRSPVFADTVGVQLLPTPDSTVEIALHATYANGTVDTSTFSETLELSEGISTTMNTETSLNTITSLDAYVYEEYKVTGGCCIDILTIETETGFGVDTSFTAETGFSMSFNLGASLEMQQTAGKASAFAASQGVTLSGGTLRMSIDIINTSRLAVRVADIALIARIPDPETGALKALGELVPIADQGTQTLAPYASATIFVENTDLPLDPVRRLMDNPKSLSVHIARYDLRDEDGKDYDFLYEDIPTKTASITLERDGHIEVMYVAADVFTDVNGKRHGVTLGDALAARGIGFAIKEADNGNVVVEVDGITGELHTTEPPNLQADGADPFGYPATGGPGARTLRRGWVGLRKALDDDERDIFYTDFFAAPLRPGDQIVLLLDEDIDQDGVPRIEEAIYGSSDLRIHSDSEPGNPLGDGLSDFFEIREGWMISPSEFVPYRVFSSPAAIDTDNDGLSDFEEQSFDGFGTDPASPDTDGDGYGDAEELADETGLYDPLTPNPLTLPEVTCTYTHEPDTCNRTFSIRLRDQAGDVTGAWLDPQDGSDPLELTHTADPGNTVDEVLTVVHCFDGHEGLTGGFVDALDSQGAFVTGECTLEVTP